jgi:uncharacterized protein YbjT (DUF2867 family)
MAASTIIVFGATGTVGSAAARAAQEFGANVVFAMRDTAKPVKGFAGSGDDEAVGPRRVRADLVQPQTIEAAVRDTRATRAFFYLAHGSPDNMRSAVEALKAGGIEFVVFLSSIGVHGDFRKVPSTNGLGYAHAQVEVALYDVFGPSGYLAIRPGYFNTNAVMFWSKMIHEGNVSLPYPDALWDWISPDDIGKVCGRVLVQGIEATEGSVERNSITICGPKLISQRDAVGIFATAIGKQIKVIEIDENAAIAQMERSGMPKFVAVQVTKLVTRRYEGDAPSNDAYSDAVYEEASSNLRKHAGTATSLEDWAAKNKDLFNLKVR